MHIVSAVPPRPVRKPRTVRTNLNYTALINAIASQSDAWLKVDGNVVAGTSILQKQNSICQAARRRGYVMQTSVQDGTIYVRILKEVSNA